MKMEKCAPGIEGRLAFVTHEDQGKGVLWKTNHQGRSKEQAVVVGG